MKLFQLLLCGLLLTTIPGMAQNKATEDLFSVYKIQTVRIDFYESDWQRKLDSLRLVGNGVLLAKVEINGEFFENVGVNYWTSGTHQLGADRNSLYADLDLINKEQHYDGQRSLVLSQALRDPSMVREVLGYEILRSYMPAPKANYAQVYVENMFYGLMVNVEAVDDAFLARSYGSTNGDLMWACSDSQPSSTGCLNRIFGSLSLDNSFDCFRENWEKRSYTGHQALYELAKALDDEGSNLDDFLAVDEVLWMHAFNNVTANLRSYSGDQSVDYFLYKGEDGRYHPIVYNLNFAFGGYKNTGAGSDLSNDQLIELDPLLHEKNPTKPLIKRLLADPFYRKVYLSHVQQLNEDYFRSDGYKNRALAIQKMIASAAKADTKRSYSAPAEFDNSLTETIGKNSKIPGIIPFMKERASFLKKHPELRALPPTIDEVNLKGRQELSSKTVENFRIRATVGNFPKHVRLYYRFPGDRQFMQVTMFDDGKNKDAYPNDGIYGAIIEPKVGESKIEYYIAAESLKLVAFSPKNYQFEVHTADLKDLNK